MSHEEVVTEFNVGGSEAYQHALESIAQTAEHTGHVLHGLLERITPLEMALGALGAGFSAEALLHVNEQFEDTSTRMAATLASLQIAPDFVSGLTAASGVIDEINKAAAALPGEAEDYVAVFTQTLPMVGAAIGGTLKDATRFTDQYVAVMSSLMVPVEDQAMTLNAALAAGTGALHRQSSASRLLLQQMAAMPGQQNLTIAKFNQMTEAQRANLVQAALFSDANKAMLDYSADKWPAVIGAIKSSGHMMLRLSSVNLFESMTKALGSMNNAFMSADGHLTHFGQAIVGVGSAISAHLGHAIEKMSERFEYFTEHSEEMLTKLQNSPAVKMLDSMFARVSAVGSAVASAIMPTEGGIAGGSGANSTLGTAAIMLATAFSGPIGALLTFAVGIDNVVIIANEMGGVLMQLLAVAGQLVLALVPVVEAALTVAVVIAQALIPIVLGAIEAISAMIDNITPVLIAFGALAAAAIALAIQQGMFDQAIITSALALDGFIAGITGANIEMAAMTLGLSLAVAGIMWLVHWLNTAGYHAEHSEKRGLGPEEPHGLASGARASLLAKLKAQTDHASDNMLAKYNLKTKVPGERGGTKMTQDFRNSRFTIQQAFAEGFDPDRVAVAFAKDVGKMAATRLSSGLEPLFSI